VADLYQRTMDFSVPWHGWMPCFPEEYESDRPSVVQWTRDAEGGSIEMLQLNLMLRAEGHVRVHVRHERLDDPPEDLTPCN
jgi:hypothetical protein